MKQLFDTDIILFTILQKSKDILGISGGIYVGQRPDNSTQEDIVINTITLTQEYLPQVGTSNVNVYVSDKSQSINGVQMKLQDRTRLRAISSNVLEVLRAAKIEGLIYRIESQAVIREPEIFQHFCNIRIAWNIQS